jgi:hypothetical protein
MARLLMRRRSRSLLVLGLSLLAVAATGGRAHAALLSPGAVFTETNNPAGNAVLAFNRAADGTLTPAGTYPTGGTGSAFGGPLGLPPLDSAGPVQLARDGDNRDCLFAVNAGSDTVASFRVGSSGLELADVEASGGHRPASLTSTQAGAGYLVMYVLNENAAHATIQGFYVSPWCQLTQIPGSNRDVIAFPAQVSFDPRGTTLVVSERFSNTLAVFPVDRQGVVGAAVRSPSANDEPYGLAWRIEGGDEILTVSEGGGFNLAGSTASTYRLVGTALVHVDSKPSPGAACWNRVTNNGKFLYVSNPAAGFDPFMTGTPIAGTSETAYAIGRDGTLTKINGAFTNHSATDNALSHDSQYLYVLSNSLFEGVPAPISAINAYRIDERTGALTAVDVVDGIPSNTISGLAAW